jgi:hypothetical protein
VDPMSMRTVRTAFRSVSRKAAKARRSRKSVPQHFTSLVRGGEVELVETLNRNDPCFWRSWSRLRGLLPDGRLVSTGLIGRIIGGSWGEAVALDRPPPFSWRLGALGVR